MFCWYQSIHQAPWLAGQSSVIPRQVAAGNGHLVRFQLTSSPLSIPLRKYTLIETVTMKIITNDNGNDCNIRYSRAVTFVIPEHRLKHASFVGLSALPSGFVGCQPGTPWRYYSADSGFAPSHWETALLCNDVSHWLGASLESFLL